MLRHDALKSKSIVGYAGEMSKKCTGAHRLSVKSIDCLSFEMLLSFGHCIGVKISDRSRWSFPTGLLRLSFTTASANERVPTSVELSAMIE